MADKSLIITLFAVLFLAFLFSGLSSTGDVTKSTSALIRGTEGYENYYPNARIPPSQATGSHPGSSAGEGMVAGVKHGDCNGDGDSFTIQDVDFVWGNIKGTKTPEFTGTTWRRSLEACDIDGNGVFDEVDLAYVKSYIATGRPSGGVPIRRSGDCGWFQTGQTRQWVCN